jgi:hypothetical protein
MFGTALEFAPGTTEDCERLIAHLFKPGDVLAAYRVARQRFGTGDLVLVTSQRDGSGFEAQVRTHYVKRLRDGLGRNAAKMLASLAVAHQSAQQIVKLPKESDAMWLIVNRPDAMPIMVVLFAAPYATGADAREPTIIRN